MTSLKSLEETPVAFHLFRRAAENAVRNSPEPPYRSSTKTVGRPAAAMTWGAPVQMPVM